MVLFASMANLASQFQTRRAGLLVRKETNEMSRGSFDFGCHDVQLHKTQLCIWIEFTDTLPTGDTVDRSTSSTGFERSNVVDT